VLKAMLSLNMSIEVAGIITFQRWGDNFWWKLSIIDWLLPMFS
jgi:hypothetical protein